MNRTGTQSLVLEPTSHYIEIFYFFDPFSNDCRALEPIINKLQLEYRGHVTIKKILAPSLQVLTKCQAQSTSDIDNIALAYKAAEIQGRNKARAFIRYVLNRIAPTRNICTIEHMEESARLAGLDVNAFTADAHSEDVRSLLKRDLMVYREMDVEELPAMVFFSGDVEAEGVKVEGVYPYHIYTYIINELIDKEIEKHPLPSIHDYIESYEVVSFHELKTVFEWRTGLLLNELKKLRLQRLVEEVETEDGMHYQIRGGPSSFGR
ncbi:DsbA family protein [Salinicoccus roseus]|uniref:DsbA family protein n=1 Tax=Salinicoccus roseus TaxID=45670 RepID=UPI0023000AB6|nr:DsbA family protein [Salinicoccus roseus]